MKEKILHQLFKKINKNDVISVIYYGNTQGVDIDLCIITNAPSIYEKRKINKLDLTIFNEQYFIYLTQLLDPLTSEPILTGKEIYGDRLNHYLQIINNVKPSEKAIKHLHDFSNQIFIASKKLYRDHTYHDSITNILFCLSYLAYADYYITENKVILFKDLIAINNNTLLTEVFSYIKSKVTCDKEKINYFITETEIMRKRLT